MSDVIKVLYPTYNAYCLYPPWCHSCNLSGFFVFFFQLIFLVIALVLQETAFFALQCPHKFVGACQNQQMVLLKSSQNFFMILRLKRFDQILFFNHAEMSSDRKTSNHHRWVVSVIIGVSCTFIVTVMLLVCWVHWYRSNVLTGYGNYKIRNTSLISCTLTLDTL